MNQHGGGRRRWSARFSLILLPVTLAVVPGTPAWAHQSDVLAPNGRSPFYAGYSYRLTGNHYNENTHVDVRDGRHVNDYYALDLNPIVANGNTCGRHVHPLWDNLRVTNLDAATGWLEMEGSPNGGRRYQLTYRHLNEIRVSQGQAVGKSTVVGTIGQRGNATGCHLHLSTRAIFTGADGGYHATHNHYLWSRRPVICGSQVPDSFTARPGCSS